MLTHQQRVAPLAHITRHLSVGIGANSSALARASVQDPPLSGVCASEI
jgi:hypothetical protein